MKSSSQRLNRTGMSTAPELARELVEGAQSSCPSSEGNAEAIAKVRIAYSKNGEPVGSIPPPDPETAPRKGSAVPPIFLDKLGERLAFERSGVRLYDALLSKFDAFGTWENGPTRADLEEIRNDELSHFTMLREVMIKLGGAPTAVTPSADVHAVASKGLCAVLADPRTTLSQSLEGILVAELVDNDCWENLSDLATALGQEELAGTFQDALDEEQEHLRRVRSWLGAGLSQTATGELDDAFLLRAERRESGMAPRPAERPRAAAKRPTRRSAPKPKRTGVTGSSKKTRKSSTQSRARRKRAS
jgi:rubrerythrin